MASFAATQAQEVIFAYLNRQATRECHKANTYNLARGRKEALAMDTGLVSDSGLHIMKNVARNGLTKGSLRRCGGRTNLERRDWGLLLNRLLILH